MRQLFFLRKIKISQKRIFWILIGVVLIVLILSLGIFPMVESTRKMEEEIALKKKVLLKYSEFLQKRKTVEEELSLVQKKHEEVQNRFLPGETPQLGAAHLQDMVKKLLEKNGMTIRSFRVLEPKDILPYRKISVHTDFNPVNNMLSLTQFIHDIENNEKELMISDMDLLVPNPRMPNNIQGSFVISGLMKMSEVKGKGRER
ncbi:MAG: hypothetical protein FJ110_00290 [Deltaproteobacteria bacterium]|nr:hypothetical protein [Deltaproteobacteria bacterium]